MRAPVTKNRLRLASDLVAELGAQAAEQGVDVPELVGKLLVKALPDVVATETRRWLEATASMAYPVEGETAFKALGELETKKAPASLPAPEMTEGREVSLPATGTKSAITAPQPRAMIADFRANECEGRRGTPRS